MSGEGGITTTLTLIAQVKRVFCTLIDWTPLIGTDLGDTQAAHILRMRIPMKADSCSD
jgi:hypothetical protein